MTLLPRVVRFGIIGAASTGAYVALGIAGIVAVAATVPLSSFLGQSLFVFPSAGSALEPACASGGR